MNEPSPPDHGGPLPGPRPTPAALVTVLARAAGTPGGGTGPAVDAGALPDYGRVRAATGVAAMSEQEFGDEDVLRTGEWLRAWVRRHRSPAVRAWLRAGSPGLPPEVITRIARDAGLALALAVTDVEVLVVGLREGWSDEWMVAVQEAGFGAAEAQALHARADGWEVVRTVLALSGRGG